MQVILPTLIFQTLLPMEQEVRKIAAYGASGVEIRRERMARMDARTLTALRRAIAAAGLRQTVYSIPESLWQTGGRLHENAAQFFAEASWLGAEYIKFGLGDFSAAAVSFKELAALLSLGNGSLHLLVENDQAERGGSLQQFVEFFRWKKELPVQMTFDTGNWTVVGESAAHAYEALRDDIAYVHIKAVRQESDRRVSIAVDEADEWLHMARRHFMAAVEFPLENPDYEAPRWIQLLQGRNDLQ